MSYYPSNATYDSRPHAHSSHRSNQRHIRQTEDRNYLVDGRLDVDSNYHDNHPHRGPNHGASRHRDGYDSYRPVFSPNIPFPRNTHLPSYPLQPTPRQTLSSSDRSLLEVLRAERGTGASRSDVNQPRYPPAPPVMMPTQNHRHWYHHYGTPTYTTDIAGVRSLPAPSTTGRYVPVLWGQPHYHVLLRNLENSLGAYMDFINTNQPSHSSTVPPERLQSIDPFTSLIGVLYPLANNMLRLWAYGDLAWRALDRSLILAPATVREDDQGSGVSRRDFAGHTFCPMGKGKGKMQKDGKRFKKMMKKKGKHIEGDQSSSSSSSLSSSSDSPSSSSDKSSLSRKSSSAGWPSTSAAKKQEEESAWREECQDEPKASFSNGHWYVNGVKMTGEKGGNNIMASVEDGSD